MPAILKLLSNLKAVATVSGAHTALAFVRAILANLPTIVRTRNLVAADLAMRGRAWPYSLQGVRLSLDGKHFGGAREMYCRQVYFPSPQFSLHPGKWVVDLGANAGLFSLLAALAGCKVLAVEAQAGFVREIEALASARGVSDRVTVENVLVGGGSGVLSDSRKLETASHFGGVVPRKSSMDALLAKHGIDEVDLMKVDIEGSEFDLFRSSAPWLARVSRLAMEVHPGHGDVEDLVATIASQGFRIELRDNDSMLVDEISLAGGYVFATRTGNKQNSRGR